MVVLLFLLLRNRPFLFTLVAELDKENCINFPVYTLEYILFITVYIVSAHPEIKQYTINPYNCKGPVS